MATFKDEKNRPWTITITIGLVKNIQRELGVNLLELEKGDPPLLTRLATDLMLLVDIIYVAIKSQADELSVSDEDFGLALNGEAISRAQACFYEELVLFFLGLGRKDLATAIQTQEQIIAQAVDLVEKELSGMDVSKHLKVAFGKESTRLPEPLGSSQTP